MSVNIFPGDDWQTKINAAAAGETFIVKPGVHLKAKDLKPKANQKFTGEPSGSSWPIVDGEFDQGKRFMNISSAGVNGVEIRKLVIRHFFLPTLQQDVIDTSGRLNCVLEDLEIHHCVGTAIVLGDNCVARRVEVHHVFMSFTASGSNGAIVEDCHWHDLNNPDATLNPYYQKMVDQKLGQYSRLNKEGGSWIVSPGWGAGFKFASALNGIIRRNEAGPNINGGQIWLDVSGGGTQIYENWVHDSPDGGGIHIEKIKGITKVYNNLVERVRLNFPSASHWGIQIGESKNVEVYGNTVKGSKGGIGIRAATNRHNEGFIARDNYIHHNAIEHSTDELAGGSSGNGNLVLTDPSYNNVFDFNTYRSTKSNPFSQNRTWTQWRAIPQDANGSFNATAPPTSRHGSATMSLGLSMQAGGRKRGKGSSSISVGLVAVASGAEVTPPANIHGISVVPLLLEPLASGSAQKHGASSAAIGFGTSALGHKEPVPPPPIGVSSMGIGFGMTARGKKRARGSAVVGLGLTMETPDILVRGESQVDVAFACTASGKKGAHGFGLMEFSMDAVGAGQGVPNDARNGSATMTLAIGVLPELEDPGDDPERHGIPGKKGSASSGVAFTMIARGRGQTPGGSGGPPPPPGGQTAAILPEEYRTREPRTTQEGFQ